MSNKVGELYNIIIENVIRETKTEFEESGDDPAVLDMLRKTWRKRLMGMNVTKEPLWEDARRQPNPDNLTGQLSHAIPGTVPGTLSGGINIGGQENLQVGGDSLGLYGMPQVKDLDGVTNPTGHGLNSTNTASNTGSMPQHPLYVKEEPFSNISVSPGATGTNQVSQDNTGAFNPLDSSKSTSSASPRHGHAQLSPELQNQINNAMNNHPRVPQADGPQDEELNSDLDDSEDELNSNDEDEDNDQTQIMLCLYEKVHKVKTRWKYTLKDGVANVNGLDYVFTRATGESEW